MDKIIEEFFKVLHRFHQCRPKFKGTGDLANVEFFILAGISCMIHEKEKNEIANQEVDKGITIGDFIKNTDISMSAASKKISILEKKGLIERKTSKHDRRNVYITLTEEGEKICEKERASKHMWMAKLMEKMGEEDATQLIVLLNKLFDSVAELEKEQEGE